MPAFGVEITPCGYGRSTADGDAFLAIAIGNFSTGMLEARGGGRGAAGEVRGRKVESGESRAER